MAYLNTNSECFADPPNHEACPGHSEPIKQTPGEDLIIGGWLCPCDCHQKEDA